MIHELVTDMPRFKFSWYNGFWRDVDRNIVEPFPLLDGNNIKTIPLEVAQEAYKAYVEFFGEDQSLERIAERGGFSQMEVIQLLYERLKNVA